jgi:hypothetical protein
LTFTCRAVLSSWSSPMTSVRITVLNLRRCFLGRKWGFCSPQFWRFRVQITECRLGKALTDYLKASEGCVRASKQLHLEGGETETDRSAHNDLRPTSSPHHNQGFNIWSFGGSSFKP